MAFHTNFSLTAALYLLIKKSPISGWDIYTQFAYACAQLGIELESSSIPQAKGRVERLNQTLQFHLPIELRRKEITTIEAANEFLNPYIKEFNEIFSLPLNDIKSVFETQPLNKKINLTLAVLCVKERLILVIVSNTIISTSTIRCSIKMECRYITAHEAKSKDLDLDYRALKPKKQYIPPMNHPWGKAAFGIFVRKQEYHWNDEEKEYA